MQDDDGVGEDDEGQVDDNDDDDDQLQDEIDEVEEEEGEQMLRGLEEDDMIEGDDFGEGEATPDDALEG